MSIVISLDRYDNLLKRTFTLEQDNIKLMYEKDLLNDEMNELKQERINLIFDIFKAEKNLTRYSLVEGKLICEYIWLEKDLIEFNDKYNLPENTIKLKLMNYLKENDNE